MSYGDHSNCCRCIGINILDYLIKSTVLFYEIEIAPLFSMNLKFLFICSFQVNLE